MRKYRSILGENWPTGRYLLPLLRKIGHQAFPVVLDLGCGDIPFRSFFIHTDHYIGIDRVTDIPGTIAADYLHIPIANSSVDLVVMFQSLSDAPDSGSLLREARRVLKNDGQLLIFESMCYPEHDLPDDYFRIMPEGLRLIAEESGFSVDSCQRLGGLFTRLSMLINTFILGNLKRYFILKPFAYFGIFLSNLLFLSLENLFSFPRLASDYLAILSVQNSGQPS